MHNFNDDESPAPAHNITPIYCLVRDCMTYVGHGRYMRSFADQFQNVAGGARIGLCGRHYLELLDLKGRSVMAQLRADPESIVSQVEAQLNKRQEP
jgi:hypothetical protein